MGRHRYNMGMYLLANQLKDLPVMSLQTGQPIAVVKQPIISPSNLEIVALQCDIGRGGRRRTSVILLRDVRQFATDCVIIDSFDDIEDASEIVRLQAVMEHRFDPVGKQVVSESGQKLGKVEDYTINLKTYMLQKLYVHQSLMKSILFNNLVIDRTQIIDVSQKQFTVKDAAETEAPLAPALHHTPK
jgi:sporulation protein YlmC with PRC-barrel domain